MAAKIYTISPTVTKIEAIVEFFKRSYTAQAKLESTLKQMSSPVLKLKLESPTRWNSCYDMLEQILTIKDAVISTLALIKNDLNLKDWKTIKNIVSILQPFLKSLRKSVQKKRSVYQKF